MSLKFTILYIAHYADLVGGGELSLLGLLKSLNRDRFTPILLVERPGELKEEAQALGVETLILPLPRPRELRLIRMARAFLELRRIIRGRSIALIHTQGFRGTFYAGPLARLLRVPLVWHLRVLERDRHLDRLLSLYATAIIAISNAVGGRIQGERGRRKLRVITNGIDLSLFHPGVDGSELREELRLSPGPLVGIVAQLLPWKGHKTFLKAARLVVERVQGVHFLVVGEDLSRGQGYAQELKNLAESLGLRERVTFTGYRRDIPEVMAALDLFVLASHDEPFGRVLVEAMAAGKPLVATGGGGVREVVEEWVTGLLVPKEDPEATADAIVELLKGGDRARRMGAAGSERAQKLFSLEANARATEELYLELLTPGGR